MLWLLTWTEWHGQESQTDQQLEHPIWQHSSKFPGTGQQIKD